MFAGMKGWVALIATAVALTTAAPTDAAPEDDYLDILSNTPGFTVNEFTGPPLIVAGNMICGDVRAGIPVDQVIGRGMKYPGFIDAAADAIVAAAQQTSTPTPSPLSPTFRQPPERTDSMTVRRATAGCRGASAVRDTTAGLSAPPA
jgi:hypothetical protein